MLRLTLCCVFAVLLLIGVDCEAQYKGDHIPGLAGLESGSAPPPGLYVGNIVWVYPTDTVKDNNGNNINLLGPITSVAPIILVNLMTNKKLFGANIGVSGAFPFIENRIQLNSLAVNSGLALVAPCTLMRRSCGMPLPTSASSFTATKRAPTFTSAIWELSRAA